MLELDGRRRLEHWLRSQEMLALDLPPLAGPDDTMFDYYVTSDGEHACLYPSITHRTSFLQMAKILTHTHTIYTYIYIIIIYYIFIII